MTNNTLNFSVTEAQAEFLALDVPFPAFIGGFYSGKSHIMAMNGFMDASQSSDATVAFYEPTHDHIKTIILPKIEALLIDHGIRYVLNKQDHVIHTSNSQFGDFLFRSMDTPALIVGYEFYRGHVDELDVLTEDKAHEVWTKVIARNRQKPKGIVNPKNKISVYSTPEGYKFVYKMWGQGTKKIEGTKHTYTSAREGYQIVRARTMDNPYADEAYIKNLRDTYPPQLAEAYLNGEFCNLASSTVYCNFSRKIHDSHETIRPGEDLFIGCDFNVDHQAATVYVKRNGGLQWHAVAELSSMKDTPEMIRIIRETWANKGHQITMYPDATGTARKSVNASVSDIAELQNAGFKVRAHRKNPDVRDRVAATNKAFGAGRLFVNTNACPEVTRCLEQQSYDKNGEPDKKSGNDHQNDATTYPIAYEMALRKPLFSLDFSFVT